MRGLDPALVLRAVDVRASSTVPREKDSGERPCDNASTIHVHSAERKSGVKPPHSKGCRHFAHSNFMKTIIQSIRALLVFTVLTGIAYPLVVTLAARAFSTKAEGSLIIVNGKIVGSTLLAQKMESPRYFWPRPSAADYATIASGASNKGPTSADLVKAIAERRVKFGADAAPEMLTASASGLDPHISPQAAQQQAARIAGERKLPLEKITALVTAHIEPPQWGIFGEARVNVLTLNLALDAAQ